MNIHWLCLFIATQFEVLWVIGLKYSTSILDWIGTLLCIAATFVLMTIAGKKLPIGTTYTVFTGIGTVCTLLSDVVFFGEKLTVMKVIFIATLLMGVIGLKLITKDHNPLTEGAKL